MNITDFRDVRISQIVTVASGQSVSSILDGGGAQLRALYFPSNFTSCNLSFLVAEMSNPSAFYNLTDVDGSSIGIPVVANQCLPVLAYLVDNAKFFQLQFDANQTQNVSILCGLMPIYQGIHG